ncbi:MAG TPA: twin-arginine translocase TatA/TatE family subunit, partial [Candidatus Acidoferrales bacterium]|nr:twin-arginine translocase TatA/TatE family subunit [Candidatus Acidoferrales bacterium]
MEFSPMHIFLVLLIVLVLFGGRKLPELMKGLGQGIREFKEGMREQPTPTNPPPSSTPANPPAAAPSEEKK